MHRDIMYCHIAEIAVSKLSRNQGIGRQLMLAAEAWGRAQGAQFASLEYHSHNNLASSFYHDVVGYKPAAIIAIKAL